VAAFTNLSHDHLDYHKSMQEYASAKKMLFDSLPATSWAVINADDPYAAGMVTDTKAKVLIFLSWRMPLFNGRVEEMSATGTSILWRASRCTLR
jgi:UDP-N-acetylmuramoyl-L-alanyl-D-glutamate--2,6-diaminopimelate ligase